MIVVDTREPTEDITASLDKLRAPYRVATLNGPEHPKADFIVGSGALAVQRKTVNDFVGSLRDGLKDDLFRLRSAHQMSALLIEGSYKIHAGEIAVRRGRTYEPVLSVEAYQNFLLSQQLRGTMLIRTANLTETCAMLAGADKYLRGDDRTPPVREPDKPSDMLQLVPSVGPKTAEALVAEYGDAWTAITRLDDWDEVDGIGQKTKQKAIDWFKGQ